MDPGNYTKKQVITIITFYKVTFVIRIVYMFVQNIYPGIILLYYIIDTKNLLKVLKVTYILGYCYRISSDRSDWLTGKLGCENETAEIASKLSMEDNDFVKGM